MAHLDGGDEACREAEARVEAVFSSTRPLLDETQQKINAAIRSVLADVEGDEFDEDSKVQDVREIARKAGLDIRAIRPAAARSR